MSFTPKRKPLSAIPDVQASMRISGFEKASLVESLRTRTPNEPQKLIGVSCDIADDIFRLTRLPDFFSEGLLGNTHNRKESPMPP